MAQYFSEQPTVGSKRASVQLALPDMTLSLITDRGVFSHGAIDVGTKLLLQEAPTPRGPVTVDLGCGYGPIACVLARRAPTSSVWAVDVNERARELCALNAAEFANVRVIAPDDWPEGLTIDTLWSNPPIRVGKAELHAVLTVWLARLSPTGSAVLVVQRHLGADSLAEWMSALGYQVTRMCSRQSYRLLEVRAA